MLNVDEAVASQNLLQYSKQLDWVHSNYDDLIKRFGDEHIAVLDHNVVAHSSDIHALMQQLRAEYLNDVPRILVEFIYREHPNFILI